MNAYADGSRDFSKEEYEEYIQVEINNLTRMPGYEALAQELKKFTGILLDPTEFTHQAALSLTAGVGAKRVPIESPINW